MEVVSTGEEHREDVIGSDASSGSSGDAGVVLDFESTLPGFIELSSEALSSKRVRSCETSSSVTRCVKLVIQDFKAFSIEEVEKRLGISCRSSHVSEDSSIGGIRTCVSSIALRVHYEENSKEVTWYWSGSVVATDVPSRVDGLHHDPSTVSGRRSVSFGDEKEIIGGSITYQLSGGLSDGGVNQFEVDELLFGRRNASSLRGGGLEPLLGVLVGDISRLSLTGVS